MPSYSKPEVVLVRYPFSDLSSSKVRPAIVVNANHISRDLFVVALTSKTSNLLAENLFYPNGNYRFECGNGSKARHFYDKRNFGQKTSRQVRRC